MGKKLSADVLNEIERKANSGIALTDPTAEKQFYYDNIVNQKKQPQRPTWTMPDMPDFNANKPGDYSSKYQGQMDGLMNQIMNRPDFSYDYSTDPLYAQYKEQYNREGDRALQNAMSEASSMTGGRMSSYAMTAGQQAQDYYNQKLNDKVPELQQIAYKMYMDEYSQMQNNLGMLQNADNTAYGRWQDGYNRWDNDRNFNYNSWWNNTQLGYNNYRDQVGDWESDRGWDRQNALDKYNVMYQGERDKYDDEWRNKEWDYNSMWRDKEWDYNTSWKDKEWNNMLQQQGQQQSNWEREFAANNDYKNASLAQKNQSKKEEKPKSKYSDSELKTKIQSMLKEEVVTGTDKWGDPVKNKKYSNNDIIEMLSKVASDEQMDKYMDYYDLVFDEKAYYMKNKGKNSGGGSGGGSTWQTMTK